MAIQRFIDGIQRGAAMVIAVLLAFMLMIAISDPGESAISLFGVGGIIYGIVTGDMLILGIGVVAFLIGVYEFLDPHGESPEIH